MFLSGLIGKFFGEGLSAKKVEKPKTIGDLVPLIAKLRDLRENMASFAQTPEQKEEIRESAASAQRALEKLKSLQIKHPGATVLLRKGDVANSDPLVVIEVNTGDRVATLEDHILHYPWADEFMST